MSLKNKSILITAGPTWVPIDSVRVISNTATGETGILLAKRLRKLGAKVTLFLGPVGKSSLNTNIEIKRFAYFDELRKKLFSELSNRKYNILIHSAAVSDYRPIKNYKGKMDSGIKKLRLELIPTDKIINLFKKTYPSIFVVGFKFEPSTSKNALFNKARRLLNNSGIELVVANSIGKFGYRAYLLTRNKIFSSAKTKKELVSRLTSFLNRN